MEPVSQKTREQLESAVEAFRAAAARVHLPEAEGLKEKIRDIYVAGNHLRHFVDAIQRASTFDERLLASVSVQVAQLNAFQQAWRELAETLDEANRQLAPLRAQTQLLEIGRSSERWVKRWENDSSAAQAALRLLEQKPGAETSDRATGISATDASIVELYYFGGLSQAQVGQTIGLSQPAVAARLAKIDRVIARELLLHRLEDVGRDEGWRVEREASMSVQDTVNIRFDLLARRSDGTELGIEVKVSEWPSVRRLRDWSERLQQYTERAHCGIAIYDLKGIAAGLYIERDLSEALQKVLPVPDVDRHGYEYMRRLLHHDLSLNAAVERANAR